VKNGLVQGKEKLMRRLAQTSPNARPFQEIEMYWKEFIASIPELSDAAKKKIKTEGVRVLEDLESQKSIMPASQFNEAKKSLLNELQELELTFGRKILAVQKRFENMWNRIERAHQTGKIDFNLPHHGIMKCNKCNAEYSFPEFFEMFEQFDAEMMYPDMLPRDEREVEEFYDGWATWANYLKLKCAKCKGSNWRDVVNFDKREL